MKVSIIIPVYNAENYLYQCLDTILSQTLRDIEIICVDDGSTDNSLKILMEYEKKDKRIKILHQVNQYAGIARNNGFKKATGEYILFLDADDFFEPTLCETCYRVAKEKNADIVVFGNREYDNSTKKYVDHSFTNTKIIKNLDVFNAEDIPDDIYVFTNPGPCNKFFKKEYLLNTGIQFQHLQNAEDVFFTLMNLTLAERICYVDEVLLNCRVGMSTNLQDLNRNQEAIIYAYRSLYDELKKRNLYSKFCMSFVSAALGSICYNADIMLKNGKRMDSLYHALRSPLFQDMKLLDYPQSFYRKTENYYFVARLFLMSKYLDERKNKNKYEILKDTKNRKYKVSIIVPIYNVELYLSECLDSLTNQSLKDIEIICVNDASTDNSLEITKMYAEKDKRIKVINHFVNMGLSTSRNTGLKEARGEYICFLDSDDYIEKDTLKKSFNLAIKSNLDCVYFNVQLLVDGDIDNDIVQMHRKYYVKNGAYPTLSRGIDFLISLCNNKEYSVSACTQLTKKQFIFDYDLFFHDGIIHEDEEFFLMAMILAEKIGYINKPYYHRRLRPQSIMTTKVDFRNAYGMFVSYNDVSIFLKRCKFLTADETKIVNKIVNGFLNTSRRKYKMLSLIEKGKYKKLDDVEKKFFKWEVVNKVEGITYYRRNMVKKLKKTKFGFLVKIYKPLKNKYIKSFFS